MIWFTSDTHFGHENIIKYASRPFSTVEEMDEIIISNWNANVKKDDVVYHLGDFSFKDPKEYIRRLNGTIVLILGNHDFKREHMLSRCINDIHTLLCIKERGHDIVLCHYAMRVWPKSHFNSWHLFGHSHGKLPSFGKSFDVGVDAMNFRPISIYEVEGMMASKEDNFNKIT